jgi:hypothetical protein
MFLKSKKHRSTERLTEGSRVVASRLPALGHLWVERAVSDRTSGYVVRDRTGVLYVVDAGEISPS